MRWCFTDRIHKIEEWKYVSGRKLSSLEEHCLCEPLGRQGVLPETLVIESCISLLRWLVTVSSGFKKTCIVSSIEEFKFSDVSGMGEAFEMIIEVAGRDGETITASCRVSGRKSEIASGIIHVELCPLAESFEPEILAEQLKELYASAQGN
ncbi:MAG: hypothetical protein WCS96_02410 [Victivallales bacterium]